MGFGLCIIMEQLVVIWVPGSNSKTGEATQVIFLCRKIWGQPSHIKLSFVGGALPTREQIYANLVLGQNKMMDFNQWSREEGLFTWVFARFSPEKAISNVANAYVPIWNTYSKA